MSNITDESAINFVNNTVPNMRDCSWAELERAVMSRAPEAKIAFDFVPVLVYAANDEFVGWYDEELEQGYVA